MSERMEKLAALKRKRARLEHRLFHIQRRLDNKSVGKAEKKKARGALAACQENIQGVIAETKFVKASFSYEKLFTTFAREVLDDKSFSLISDMAKAEDRRLKEEARSYE